MINFGLLTLGLFAGVLAGLFGIGGGIVIIPGLILIFGMEVKQASATTLAALIPPVGLLGAIELYRADLINIRYAALIAAGIFIGAYFGAKIMIGIQSQYVARMYGGLLLLISLKMLILGR
jgi:uncharacterized membrane protein YfcA